MEEIVSSTPDAPKKDSAGNGNNHNQNPKWWNPRWTLGIGIPVFIAAVVGLFIACRFYVGHPNDTPAFVAGVIGLLTLAAIVAQAVIYKKQSDLMREGLDKTQRLVDQNDRLITTVSEQSDHMQGQLTVMK